MENQLDKFEPGGDIVGTYYVGEVSLNYEEVCRLLGPPVSGDNYKTAMEWVFTHVESGAVYTLYDWKETSLYDENLISVQELKQLPEINFHIGGSNHTYKDEFIEFIKNKRRAMERG